MFSADHYNYEGMLHTPKQRQDAIRQKALELIRRNLNDRQLTRILQLYDQVKRTQTFSSLGNRDQRLKKVKLLFQEEQEEQEAQRQRQLWEKLFQELDDKSTTSLQKLEKILRFMNTHGNTKIENGILSNTIINKKLKVPFLRSLLEFNTIISLPSIKEKEKSSTTTLTTPFINLSPNLITLDEKIKNISNDSDDSIWMKMFHHYFKGETIPDKLLKARQAQQARQAIKKMIP